MLLLDSNRTSKAAQIDGYLFVVQPSVTRNITTVQHIISQPLLVDFCAKTCTRWTQDIPKYVL